MKVKAAKMEAKLLMASNALTSGLTKKARTPEQKTAAVAMGTLSKKAAREQAKVAKAAAVEIAKKAKADAKEAKVVAKIEAAQMYEQQKAAAAQNLRSVLGKNPRMANVLRLAGIRRSGANISVNDFLKVARHGRTMKNKSSSKANLNNFSPELDACAQCEMKKFLEKED
jgi:ABC-type Na+ efflux pump permease subunit